MSVNKRKNSSGWDEVVAEKILQEKRDMPGALLPILNALQKKFGYIAPEFVPAIAQALNLSRAEVHGVISFYHDYRQMPPGAQVVKLCRAEACQSMAGRNLENHVKQKLGLEYHGTTSSGDYTLEPVYCLGNCACAPSMMIDDKLYGRVTPEKFDALLDKKENPA
jgi:formate dehydrogenase subunit gamma